MNALRVADILPDGKLHTGRGSVLTACGEVASAPLYTQMPSGLSVLYFRLRCENPSGKGALLRIVSYGDAAKRDSRTLQEGARVFLSGLLQGRDARGESITEIVRESLTVLTTAQTIALQTYGARAALVGEIVDGPLYTLLGEIKTPFVKFMLRCANPKDHHAVVAVVHFGSMADTYAQTLSCGMQVVVAAEVRSHYYYPPESRRGVYILQFVTDSVQVGGLAEKAVAQ